MVIACLVSDFDNKCRPTKLNMTKTKLKNVDRWFQFSVYENKCKQDNSRDSIL